ncbi:GNAT family N-acetyltransferase [Limosilactobacillus fastidiosus]|uniref:GNAT family N-acetyltransferase n=1 Tax=Limosilactobacillus fastidiosus TaxID=2759855 RepID=A0A7W3TZX3_9LACO|nr:GNAT family N-acetyltransferase [Limosilactobacillus fastidiosus]MBB1063265.1 GNAT family N-acetyltransferase [Limosilactobacillus fastidiosus]MBB1086095.1 GNAT family N-acetyltransferase [Limosilactobacillus fastidiosus]MCD7084575.1 GNAT family N-acetyltransferase [Limosilactobacillus fastidiosus]MCD7085009.1 GNAT family N-acetyltransferase [Limosilactobacillus fastidiosus]MCD7114521.1 GNAT family N-acetyltransferase [Limosilactobacillus fastidiosus]
MADTVKIKLAEPKDASQVLNFLRKAASESDAVTIPHLERVTVKEEQKNLQVINDSDDCVILLAVLGDQIIGMVTVMRLTGKNEIGELGIIVAKKYWRHGIGQLLVDEAQYWYSNYSSLSGLVLDVFEDNLPAINLYRKMNFVVQKHVQIAGRPALLMTYNS